jgi:probable HAF family extracellular repeat protein
VRYHVEDLGKLPGDISSVAAGINDAGDVVGWTSSGLSDTSTRAFIYKNGGWMIELQPLRSGTARRTARPPRPRTTRRTRSRH